MNQEYIASWRLTGKYGCPAHLHQSVRLTHHKLMITLISDCYEYVFDPEVTVGAVRTIMTAQSDIPNTDVIVRCGGLNIPLSYQDMNTPISHILKEGGYNFTYSGNCDHNLLLEWLQLSVRTRFNCDDWSRYGSCIINWMSPQEYTTEFTIHIGDVFIDEPTYDANNSNATKLLEIAIVDEQYDNVRLLLSDLDYPPITAKLLDLAIDSSSLMIRNLCINAAKGKLYEEYKCMISEL